MAEPGTLSDDQIHDELKPSLTSWSERGIIAGLQRLESGQAANARMQAEIKERVAIIELNLKHMLERVSGDIASLRAWVEREVHDLAKRVTVLESDADALLVPKVSSDLDWTRKILQFFAGGALIVVGGLLVAWLKT